MDSRREDETKAKIKGIEVEGEPEELARLLQAYEGKTTSSASAPRGAERLSRAAVPSIEKIVEYMKSKTDYTHTWEEIREQLYGGKLGTSGKEGNIYRLFYSRVQLARAKIEQEEKGKFKREGNEYKFVKN